MKIVDKRLMYSPKMHLGADIWQTYCALLTLALATVGTIESKTLSLDNVFSSMVSHCPAQVVYINWEILEYFQKCSQNMKIVSTLGVKIENLSVGTVNNVSNAQISAYPKFLATCQTVFTLLGKADGSFAQSEPFKNFVYNTQRPRRDHFVFLSDGEISVPLNSWIFSLRNVYFANFHDRLCPLLSRTGDPPTNQIPSETVREFLQRNTLRATFFVLEPYVVMKDGEPIGGFFYNLLKYSASYYNFTYDLALPKFVGGSKLPNGTWYGPLGDVIYGRRDMVFGSGRTLQRNPIMDFPDLVDLTGLKYTTAHPRITIDWVAILYIFEFKIWIYLLISCVFICSFILMAERTISNRFPISDYELVKVTGVVETVAAAVGPLLEQQILIPSIGSIKFLMGLWMLVSLVVGTYYKSDFIAYVTYPKHERIPRSFRELSERSDYTIKLMNLNAVDAIFYNTTRNPTHRKIRDRLIFENNWVQCMFEAALEERVACINFEFIGRGYLAKNMTLNRSFSSGIFSSDSALTLHLSIGFTRHSKFVDSISEIIRLLRDTGNIRKWMAEAYDINSQKGIPWLKAEKNENYFKVLTMMENLTSKSKVSPFKLKNVWICYIFLASGLATSIVTFGFEFLAVATKRYLMVTIFGLLV
ncbi:unnamed protein product [Allacma fusca]|uniref:Uncharacterized protein n=1 Tax=Allacma fusca TaxID=39272 RepID=A0A8J2J0M2_9HEXA|nr:unnamed protein product [Allacma fusca]